MFSDNTLIAIRLIHVLHKSGNRPQTISELKYKSRVCDPGNMAGRVIRHMRKEGWVESDSRNRYRLAVDLYEKSLLDLVIDIDAEIRLGRNASVGYWDIGSGDELPRVKALSERLRKELIHRIDDINLGELVIGRPADKIYASAENTDRVTDNSVQPSMSAETRNRVSGW